MKTTGALIIALSMACLSSCNRDPLESYPPSLTIVKNSIKAAFVNLDNLMDGSTARLSQILGDTAAVRAELKGMFTNRPSYVLEYALVTPAGIMEIIEPPAYYPTQGTNISSQDHIIKVFSKKEPVLSNTFLAVEGFYAVVDVHPVLKNGIASGAFTTLFYPHKMLDPIIDPQILNQDYEIWMMDSGGTLIWDQDLPDIGRNLFTDPYYDPFPNLKIALEKIAAEDYGETTYSFFQATTTIEVVKRAHWVTFSHHGQEWKIVHVKIEE
jgi:hypothetical protein